MRVKSLAKSLCPPPVWEFARRAYRRVVAPRRRISVEQIDAELERAARALEASYDAHMASLTGFELRYPADWPRDPHGPAYRAAVMELYRRLSGRAEYAAEVCEATPFDARQARFPYPYFTASCRAVGGTLAEVGFLIEALDAAPPARVLEFGCGYGKATIELAQMGFAVTAVDVYRPFLELTAGRCAALGQPIATACAGMLDYDPPEPFDRVVFSACFHHCADHARMAGRLARLVAPGGAVLFANEPVSDDFPVPWGPNPGGDALWAIRRHGWLELGFRTDYFRGLLARHGWRCERRSLPGRPNRYVFVARRA